jgi:hypothetical protein
MGASPVSQGGAPDPLSPCRMGASRFAQPVRASSPTAICAAASSVDGGPVLQEMRRSAACGAGLRRRGALEGRDRARAVHKRGRLRYHPSTAGGLPTRGNAMAEHRRGEMDIETQKKTFARFVKIAGYVVVLVAVVLLLLTFRI